MDEAMDVMKKNKQRSKVATLNAASETEVKKSLHAEERGRSSWLLCR